MGIPVTLLTASLLGVLLFALIMHNARARGRVLKAERQGPVPEALQAALDHRLRVVANFTEYVPFTLVLLAALEMSSLPLALVEGLAATLVLGRALHAWGLSRSAGPSFGRFVGTSLTWIVLLGGSVAGLYATFFTP